MKALILGLIMLLMPTFCLAEDHILSLEERFKKCGMGEEREQCLNKLENELLRKSGGSAIREGDLLTVYMSYAGGLSYKDRPIDTEGYSKYRYWGYYDDLKYHLIGYYGYEWHNYYFVSQGNQSLLSALPHVSPNKELIVTVAASENGRNEIVIWKYIDGRLEQIFKHIPREYALYEFTSWQTDAAIKLKKFTNSDKKLCPESSHMTISENMVLSKNQKWELIKEPDSEFTCKYDLRMPW